MAETKDTGGTGGTGSSGGTGGSGAGGSGQKTLEMRVAELEDRLSKIGSAEGQSGGVTCFICNVAPCLSMTRCVAIAAQPCQQCSTAGVAPPPPTAGQEGKAEALQASQPAASQKGVQACIAQQPVNPITSQLHGCLTQPCVVQQCIVQHCVMQCIIQHCIHDCVIQHCIIQQCINECGGGCLPGGGGVLGGGGFGTLGR